MVLLYIDSLLNATVLLILKQHRLGVRQGGEDSLLGRHCYQLLWEKQVTVDSSRCIMKVLLVHLLSIRHLSKWRRSEHLL